MCHQSKKIGSVLAGVCLIGAMWFGTIFAIEPEEDLGDGVVAYSNGRLSIDAKEIRPEDLFKEIGEKCGIKVVVYGEVFSEVPVSLKFQDMPVRNGIERVLRMTDISNHLMHFEEADNGSRIIEINLIGEKGGEKHLTPGSSLRSQSRERKLTKDTLKNRQKKNAPKDQLQKNEAMKLQENFLNIMDEILNTQLEKGEEPDPAEILRLFKGVVPPEMKDQIPPEVLEELEKLE